MILKSTIFSVFIISLFTSCVAKVSNQQTQYKSCKVSAPKAKIEYEPINVPNCHGKTAPICLAVYGVVVPVGSTVISGSIYIVNNSIHWLEYQGKCDEDELKVEVDKLKKGL